MSTELTVSGCIKVLVYNKESHIIDSQMLGHLLVKKLENITIKIKDN